MKAVSAIPTSFDVTAFRARLLGWYERNGRHDLPWRQTRDAYAVLVSEVMLQQTQAARVVGYFESWMGRWPTVVALAEASPADVIRAWAGLGYNRRALALHRLAVVCSERGGRVPTTVAELRALPGVGPYTAGAVACFAGEVSEPFADTNIARVIGRSLIGRAVPADAGPAAIALAAVELLPAEGARDHNLALMDLGALVCVARSPSCGACPVAELCEWQRAGAPPAAQRAKRAAPRFESTARFARGRIVDALRAASRLGREQIAATLPAAHASRIDEHLGSLLRDGLVVVEDGWWRLPGQPDATA